MVNGSLGLQLQGRASTAEMFAYAVVVALMFGLYCGVTIGSGVVSRRVESERRSRNSNNNSREKVFEA